LRALARQTRQAQRFRHGEYVELAGLAHLDPGTLLGGLCELATMLTDAERVAIHAWKPIAAAKRIASELLWLAWRTDHSRWHVRRMRPQRRNHVSPKDPGHTMRGGQVWKC
jgi:hypothetical protein